MPELTGRQQLLLQYLQFRQEGGLPPTIAEMARAMCRSGAAVRRTLDQLEARGRLVRRPGSRGHRAVASAEEVPA